MTSASAPLAVFAGSAIGGALRLAIDAAIPTTGAGLPLDIVTINIVGAFAMGALAAWVLASGTRWWVPMAGTGGLGAFTTFSALAALPWLSDASPAIAVGALALTMVASVAAAGLGWPLGTHLANSRVAPMEQSP